MNLDDALCDQIFATVDGELSCDELALRLFQGGYISLDTVLGQQKQVNESVVKVGGEATTGGSSATTWYKSEIEPCVGTSIFLEVPLPRRTPMTTTIPSDQQ